MDRNLYLSSFALASLVALRKESVDRNTNPGSTTLTFPVALRKESVDRNWAKYGKKGNSGTLVALRKESVDRNSRAASVPSASSSRSPQGERG